MTCAISDCQKDASAAGLCSMHYARQMRHGDPNYLHPTRVIARQSMMRRLIDGIADDSDCWLWGRATSSNGYGHLWVGGDRKRGVHVLMWETYNGRAVPEGLMVCHACDVRHCINPNHLWIGTNGDNQRDAVQKGRRITSSEIWCGVPLCEREHYARGVCEAHYQRFTRSPFPHVRAAIAPYVRPALPGSVRKAS